MIKRERTGSPETLDTDEQPSDGELDTTAKHQISLIVKYFMIMKMRKLMTLNTTPSPHRNSTAAFWSLR